MPDPEMRDVPAASGPSVILPSSRDGGRRQRGDGTGGPHPGSKGTETPLAPGRAREGVPESFHKGCPIPDAVALGLRVGVRVSGCTCAVARAAPGSSRGALRAAPVPPLPTLSCPRPRGRADRLEDSKRSYCAEKEVHWAAPGSGLAVGVSVTILTRVVNVTLRPGWGGEFTCPGARVRDAGWVDGSPSHPVTAAVGRLAYCLASC